MRKFITKVFVFFMVVCTVFCLCLFFLPDAKSDNSILGEIPVKHKLLDETRSPKIVFIGGSSVAMGIDSKRVAAAFNMAVVNNGVSGYLGMQYILNDIKEFVKTGDIIILSGDYTSYLSTPNNDYDSKEYLPPVLFNIYPESRSFLTFREWLHVCKYFPHFTASKIKQIFTSDGDYSTIYKKTSFNDYGDLISHWNLPSRSVPIEPKSTGTEAINDNMISDLQTFQNFATKMGAQFYILPPPLQATSYHNQLYVINKIKISLLSDHLPLVGSPEDYKYDDKYFFDYPYHLNKDGMEKHTDFIIRDLSKHIVKK